MGVREIPPHMVLVEESDTHQLFRFNGKRWALVTLFLGLACVGIAVCVQFAQTPSPWLQLMLAGFGVLLLFSSVYSFLADQWLLVDGVRHTLKFHKKNLYGSVEWERPGSSFKGLRVFRGYEHKSWTILLRCHDGLELSIGDSEFGCLDREGALALARKAGGLAGIAVIEG